MKKVFFASAFFLFALTFSPLFSEAKAACLGLGQLCGSPGDACCSGLTCTVIDPFSGVSTCETTPVPTTDTNLWCEKNVSLNTAIGCIPVLGSKEAFLSFVLKWAVGIGGGIAFLLIIYAGFMIMTSAGNPERLKAGQELLTSAISGLILLIFSVVILKIIGVDILGLDKFGFNQ